MAASNTKAVSKMRQGLPVTMAIGIEEALALMGQGRIGLAAEHLRKTLLYASITNRTVQEVVGVENLYEPKF